MANESPNLPIPPGAYEVDSWHSSADGAQWRPFKGEHHDIDVRYSDHGYVRLELYGEQYADGTVERCISVGGEFSLFPAEAREMARVLNAAADRLNESPASDPACLHR
ncbi:hypothetical protein [Mycobacterium marseillense]|uniref:hypothetical protein n=1 Tax=Mycobacterium marseillense TaxID=701042 RepID=UPI00119E3529|nr:hypothetical protein [Mycobacterium marseillense]